jgi:hypothetical protein
LSYDGTVGAGEHELSVEMTRQFLTGWTSSTMTPFQFVDNVIVDAPVGNIPEPGTLTMLFAGLALLGVSLHKRHRS